MLPMAEPSFDLAELIDSWMVELRSENKSKNTLRSYRNHAEAFIAWAQAKDVTPTLSRKLVVANIAESLDELKLDASYMRVRLTALKSFAAWCQREGELPSDEVAGIKPPKIGKKHRPILQMEDFNRLLATCARDTFEGKRDRALLLMLRDTGGRAHEIVGIQTKDITVTKGRVLLHGKGDKERIAPFRSDTASALDRYIRERRRHKSAESPALWLGMRGGGPLGYYGLWAMIQRRAVKADVQHVHPHMFRRMFADQWLRRDGSLDGLMAIAGWEDPRMVKHYAGDTANERALEEAERLFGSS